VRKCVLAGFSDQLAKRLDAGTLPLRIGAPSQGLLARESVIQKTRCSSPRDQRDRGRGGEVNVLLSVATGIEGGLAEGNFPDDYRETKGDYDQSIKRVVPRGSGVSATSCRGEVQQRRGPRSTSGPC